jgi:hypothetical protein
MSIIKSILNKKRFINIYKNNLNYKLSKVRYIDFYYNKPNTVFFLTKEFNNKYNIGKSFITSNTGVVVSNDPTGSNIKCFDFYNKYLTLNTGFELSNNDFTIDWYQYSKTSVSRSGIWAIANTNGWCGLLLNYISDTNGKYYIYASSTGSTWDLISGNVWNDTPIYNKWEHYAVTRKNEKWFGSLICESSDGLVQTNVSGFSDADRERITKEMDEWIDKKIITVRANSLMPNDKGPRRLFLPRFVEERLDKTEADSLEKIIQIFDEVMKGEK